MAYSITERGSKFSPNYRMFFRKDNNDPISPLHDIPLFVNEDQGICNMVVEIPRWTNAEMEIAMDEPLNPIRQVIKEGKPNFVPNCFPFHGSLWNYGSLTQTWENPNYIFDDKNSKGDNHPLDVIEVGERVAKLGEVVSVKVLGAITFIDKGILDYKVMAIDVRDPFADKLESTLDVTLYCPMLIHDTEDWFELCNIFNGKLENRLAFNETLCLASTLEVINKCHNEWTELFKLNGSASLCLVNTTLMRSETTMLNRETAENIIQQTPCYEQPSPIDALEVNQVHYVV